MRPHPAGRTGELWFIQFLNPGYNTHPNRTAQLRLSGEEVWGSAERTGGVWSTLGSVTHQLLGQVMSPLCLGVCIMGKAGLEDPSHPPKVLSFRTGTQVLYAKGR